MTGFSNVSRGWYVIYVRSKYEKKVDSLLQKAGIESYLPLVKKMEKWSDRKKLVYKPLLPSYVFVYINHPSEFWQVESVQGVSSFVRFGKERARVRVSEIENIKLLLETNLSDIQTTNNLPKVNEVRTIRHGILAGLECEVMKIDRKETVVVRINSINLQITASIPSSYLQPI